MAIPKQENAPLVAFTLDFESGDVPKPSNGITIDKIAITQIALHATRLDTFEHLGSFVRYVRPYNRKEIKALAGNKRKVLKSKFDNDEPEPMIYNPEALEYSGITMDILEQQGEDIIEVAQGAYKFIQDKTPKCSRNIKPFIIGQNIGFDEALFCQLMEYGGLIKEVAKLIRGHVDYYGHWHPLVLDTIILGQLALCHRPEITSYKLELLCELLGIELDDAHDANADTSATTNVVAVMAQRMRSIGGIVDGGELNMTKTEKSRKHFKI